MAQRAVSLSPPSELVDGLRRVVAALAPEQRTILLQLVEQPQASELLRAALSEADEQEHQDELQRWRTWFEHLAPGPRQELADRARVGGLPMPEGFEAAFAVLSGDYIAAQMTPDEQASVGCGDDLEPKNLLSLDEWLHAEGG